MRFGVLTKSMWFHNQEAKDGNSRWLLYRRCFHWGLYRRWFHNEEAKDADCAQRGEEDQWPRRWNSR